ncbi:MAG: hypothetical protein AAF330_07800, partial [Pseudomonadota bacterium]
MFKETKKSMQWGEETLTLETGKVARQADGSVIATLGETSVMANVTFAKSQKPDQDFFPLTVHYNEKYYAAGKIPGGFFKREARPSEAETLTSRLIDRPIRPPAHGHGDGLAGPWAPDRLPAAVGDVLERRGPV